MDKKIKDIEEQIGLIKQSLEKIEKAMAAKEDLGKLYGGMREFFDDIQCCFASFALIDHLLPLLGFFIFHDVFFFRHEIREKAHAIGMIGHDQEIERFGQACFNACGGGDLITSGKFIGLIHSYAVPKSPGVHGKGRMEMCVPEIDIRRIFGSLLLFRNS